jgi:hypothetical protein
MPGPARTAASLAAPDTADREGAWRPSDDPSPCWRRPDGNSGSQARTQAPSWRARPSTSSRRRLTAATRSDHHTSLRPIPR